MQVKKIKAGGVNVQLENFIGEHGTLFYDSTYGNLRLSDGHTPGGISVAGLGGGSIVQQDTAPLASTSTIWYDTISGRTYVYFDGSWIDASPASNSTTTVDLSAVAQDIIPAINAQYNLGSEIYQWKSLYVSTNTIYIGNVPLTIDTLTNILLVNGSSVTSGSASTSTLVNNNLTVSLDTSGTLNTPLLIPRNFVAVFDNAHHTGGTLTLSGTPWQYNPHWEVSQQGEVVTQIDAPVWYTNPGYTNGDTFIYTTADHGIPGYTFTLALSDITYPGPAGWTANVLASQSPDYPSTVKSLGAFKLSANDKNWIFAPSGNLVFPDGSTQKQATNIIQSDTQPTGSTSTLWYDTVVGRSYVYFDNSWVDANPTAFTGTATSLANGGPSITVDSYGSVTAPGNVTALGFITTGSIVIPNNGQAGSIQSQNGQGNIYFNTDNSLVFIITGTYQTSFNADGTVTFPGYVFPEGTPTTGQVLTAGNNPLYLEWDTPSSGFATTSTLVNGSYTVTLGTDGNLTAPGDVSAYSLILNNGEYQNSINLVGADTFVFGGHTRLVSNDIHTSLSPGSTTAYIQLSVLNEGNAETNDWLFNKDGTLTLPGGNSVSDSMSGGIALAIPKPPITITISGADFSAVNLTYIRDPNQTTPTWGASFYDISSDPHIVFDTGVWGIVVPGFNQALYVNTGSINSPLTQWNTNPPLGTIAPTGVYTYASAWTFGADLTLTVPGDIRGQAMLGLSGDFEGHVVNIAPAAEASNKKFKFRIDQLGGQQFTRAFLDMPTAENDHIVAIDFPHTNGTSGFIFNQGDDTNGQGMNNAFNILFNSGDIKLTAEGTDGLKTWRFGNDGGLTFPNSGGVQTQAWNDTNFMAALASYDGAVAFNTATVGTGGLTVNGPVQFNGSFTFQGTATVINSNSGTFYGDVNGVGALYAGVAGSTPLPATVIQSAADINDYIQNNFQNLNHGTQASTEWVATNDLGDDSNNYIDIGIAGHGWDGTQANSVGTAAGPSDSWVYTQGTVSSSEGGNLILGTIKDGKAVKILAGSNGAGSLVAQFNASGLALTTGTGITFPDGTRQTSAVSSSGTVVLETLNVSNISATNITINGQSITAGVTRITAGTGTHVSTTTGALTLWTDTFNTSTLVAQAVTALSIPYSNVTGTPNLSGYATQSAVSTLQISVNNLTNTVSTLTTTATVNALIANSLTNYATQSYVTTQGYTTTATVNALIANSLTNVVKTIVAGTGTAVSVSGNTVTIWTTASGGIANLNNLSSDISFSTAGVGAPTFNTTSTGVKISYYPSESATMVDYATGIDAGVLWNSIPSATSNFAFKWYGGTSTVATLNGLGTLTATKFVGDGSSLTNVTVNVAGSILGTGTNVTLVAGSYSYLFDNTGTFTMPANGDIVMTGSTATIQTGGAITAGYNSPSGATAFIAGNAAVNNIALGYQPTSGAANMAIRDLSTVTTVMYFDAGSNTTSTNSQFQFRSSSAYTLWAKIDQYGVNQPTRPAFRVYGAGTTNNLTTTANTNGILNSNNWAVDYQQGTALTTNTGIFTAPVAGLYSVHLVARVSNTSSAQIAVVKNYATTANIQAMWECGANCTANHFGVSSIVKLAAGDTLVIKVLLGQINFDGNDSWAVAYIG